MGVFKMTRINDNDGTLLAFDKTYDIDYSAEDIFDRGAG